METFAGRAEMTRMFRCSQMRSAKMDLLYMDKGDGGQNPMDLCTPAGFANLASYCLLCFTNSCNVFSLEVWSCCTNMFL